MHLTINKMYQNDEAHQCKTIKDKDIALYPVKVKDYNRRSKI